MLCLCFWEPEFADCHPHGYGCEAIHWSMGSLSAITFSKKNYSVPAIIHCKKIPREQWAMEITYLTYARSFAVLILSCCEVMVVIMPRRQHLMVFILQRLHSFLFHISWALVMIGLRQLSHIGLSTQALLLNTLSSYISLNWLLSLAERSFFAQGWKQPRSVGASINI